MQCYRDLAPSIIAALPPPTSDEQPQDMQADESMDAPKPSALTPARLGRKPPHPGIYIPRIYGFRVSEFATSGPRMQWMRERPHSLAELEQT